MALVMLGNESRLSNKNSGLKKSFSYFRENWLRVFNMHNIPKTAPHVKFIFPTA
jgi:hypothetical protein